MSAAMFDAIEQHLEERRAYITQVALTLANLQQSPIEDKLGLAFLTHPLAALPFISVQTEMPEPRRCGFYIIPQLRIGSYRADFALVIQTDGYSFRLAVECDGHDFHEKTKEQAAHDKARDRFFLERGWPVMRFTGSEIHRDAPKCANQAMDFLLRAIAKHEGKEHTLGAL